MKQMYPNLLDTLEDMFREYHIMFDLNVPPVQYGSQCVPTKYKEISSDRI